MANIIIPVGTTATLQHADGNVSRAAKILGIDRSTIYCKMERHRLR